MMTNDLCLKWSLDPNKLPKHIGIVMDGNGRWASQRRLPRVAGHAKGVERVQEIFDLCKDLNIPALTLYAFSEENWKRPQDEINGIMGLLRLYLRKERSRILDNNIRFQAIGERSRLGQDIKMLIENLEQDTSENTGMFLSVAISYGAQAEILKATQALAQQVKLQKIEPQGIDMVLFEKHLYTHNLPALDMFVRTGGEYRVSNFLLWQLAYAELFFDGTLWPDFEPKQLIELLKQFAKRNRRFGMTPEQVGHSLEHSK